MKNKQKLQDYFQVFYHPNEFISQFRCAFDSLADSLHLIRTEYPDFLSVIKEKIKYPLVTVLHRNNTKEEFPLFYFSMIKMELITPRLKHMSMEEILQTA